ncbi:MAG: SH3 domain-containing protein [Alphaproteobacteria bacterium]|nr:SH3 domain-containing protein [Alphaproteobacteria bacterium]
MKNIGLIAATGFCLAMSAGAAQAQVPRGTCLVSDPTGTPLNVRSGPNGRIIGNLYNGDYVVIQRTSRDDRGRPWALVGGTDGSTHGWIFREFVSCRN